MKEARAMAEWIRVKGTINLEKWTYLRGVYGSAAYSQDGWDDLDRSLD
jgi:hypothetical protein